MSFLHAYIISVFQREVCVEWGKIYKWSYNFVFIFCCFKVWFWQIVKAIKCTHRIVSCLITTMEISKKNFFGWILGKIWKFLKLSYPVFLSPNKSIPCAVILIILYQLLASCFFAFLWWAVYSCKSPCGLNFFYKKASLNYKTMQYPFQAHTRGKRSF